MSDLIPNTTTAMSTAAPRILMPTMRRINSHAAWASLYEFEDVIRAVDDVQMLELEAGPWFPSRHRVARSVAWHGRHPAFARINPGLKTVVVDREYDLFIFICMNLWDLLYLNAVRGWQSRCRVKVCYLAEFYSAQAGQYDHLLRRLGDFDYIMQAFSSSVPAVSRAIGKTSRYLPLAADVLRFTPFTGMPRRVIDVLSIGGRSEPVHEQLLKAAKIRDLFYVYDTLPSPLVKPTNPQQHRELLANCAKRSRFFVAYEAKVGNTESHGQSEVGTRYFEGTAAGAVLFGRAPTVPSFGAEFPWPDPVVTVKADGSDVEEVLDSLAGRSQEMERMSVRNALQAVRRHDWGHRWNAILQLCGLAPRPALAKRLLALETLSGSAAGFSPAA